MVWDVSPLSQSTQTGDGQQRSPDVVTMLRSKKIQNRWRFLVF
jgi:hypothetical protein